MWGLWGVEREGLYDDGCVSVVIDAVRVNWEL